MSSESARLRRVLGRYRKNELPAVLQHLGVEPEEGAGGATKQQLLATALRKQAAGSITQRDITRLELHYLIAHPNSTQWRAYHFDRVNESVTSSVDVDTGVFLKRFMLYLGDLCTYDLVDIIKPPGHWICLHLTGVGHTPYSCFLLRCPPIPIVLVSGVRKAHLESIMESLAVTLECCGWSDMDLVGRDASSLLDLLLHQHSQGPFTSFRLNPHDPTPLLAIGWRGYRVEEVEKKGEKWRSNGGDPPDGEMAAEQAFGTNPLPRLDKFTFKLEAPLTDGSDTIHCRLKFTGSSVLAGVKRCIGAGLVSLPVPPTVLGMASHASNSVTVALETTPTNTDVDKDGSELVGNG